MRSQAERVRRIETGEQRVVGVNCFTETAPSPLTGDGEIENVMKVDHRVEAEQIADVERWRAGRDQAAVRRALDALRRVAEDDGPGGNIMEATIALAHAGGTTGEWAGALRQVFGEFRAPTGVGGGVGRRGDDLAPLVARTRALAARTGGPPRLLVAKPGLDGHSNGAEQIAVAARDAGLRSHLPGHPAHPGPDRGGGPGRGRRHRRALHPVGLPHGAGPRHPRPPARGRGRRRRGGGGIIPPDDAEILLGKGVASVYTPKDYSFERIMEDLVGLAERQRAATPAVRRASSRQVMATAPSSMARSRRLSGRS